MRTTVDLPPRLHERVIQLARASHRSVSATLADLTARGLAQLDPPVTSNTDNVTGFPLISVGRPVTQAQVVDLLDEE